MCRYRAVSPNISVGRGVNFRKHLGNILTETNRNNRNNRNWPGAKEKEENEEGQGFSGLFSEMSLGRIMPVTAFSEDEA